MKNFITTTIETDEIKNRVQDILNKSGRLVVINGYIDKEEGNIVIYTLEYEETREQLIIKGKSEIPSITSIYKGAQWFEEEIEELMDIKFIGLENKGRLFLPDEFKDGEGKILVLPLDELKKLNEK